MGTGKKVGGNWYRIGRPRHACARVPGRLSAGGRSIGSGPGGEKKVERLKRRVDCRWGACRFEVEVDPGGEKSIGPNVRPGPSEDGRSRAKKDR